MPRKSASSSPQLNFHTFESGFHYAHGLLTDHMGNTFHIEVKGMNVNHVKQHIKYLVRKTHEGQGITVEFRPLTQEEQKEQGAKISASKDSVVKTTKRGKRLALDDLIVTINPVKLDKKTSGPHRLSIIIDPQISTTGVQKIFYSFPIQKTIANAVEVACKVNKGHVNFELFQSDSPQIPGKADVLCAQKWLIAGPSTSFSQLPVTGTKNVDVYWYVVVSLSRNCSLAVFTLTKDFNYP